MASILKVGELQHTNGTSALTIDSAGRISEPAKPSWKITGRTSGATIGVNNASVFQFAATDFTTGGVTVTNTFSRVTVPVAGKYWVKTIINQGGPGQDTEVRYFTTSINKNGSSIVQQLQGLESVSDGWGHGNSYHVTQAETIVDLAAGDYLEVVLSRASSSDWNATIYDDGGKHTSFFGYLVA